MVATPRAIIITVEEPCVAMQTETNSGMTGRKRRLAHLSVEEKIHRKKLKNRVAAQTSRDRKKARMDELENTVSLLNERAEELSTECTTLRHRNEALTVENTSLKRQLQEAQATTAALLESLRNTTCGCGRPTQTVASTNSQADASDAPLNLPRPAESSALPLLKGLSGHQAASLRILQMLLTAAFLLSRNCSQTSGQKTSQTCATWSALQRACSKMHLSSLDGRSLEVWDKWWGRHQKMWNPVEELPLQTVLRQTLRSPS